MTTLDSQSPSRPTSNRLLALAILIGAAGLAWAAYALNERVNRVEQMLGGLDGHLAVLASAAAVPRAPAVAPSEAQRLADGLTLAYQQILPPDSTRWLGVPIEQLPNDCWALQEIFWETKPEVVLDIGTSRGGTALFFASLLALVNPGGRVLTVDVNSAKYIAADATGSPLWKDRVRFIQGSSVAPEVVATLRREAAGHSTFILLDTLHTRDYVLKELAAYADLVSVGGYIMIHDTSANGHPLGSPNEHGPWDAVHEFVQKDDRFQIDRSRNRFLVTLSPSGFLKRIK